MKIWQRRSRKNGLKATKSTRNVTTACTYHNLIYIKQIMTDLEGNRQIYLPQEIQDRLPKSFYCSRGQ